MVNFVWYKINFLSELRLSTLYTIFMTTQLFKANTRGTADFGWLKANFFLSLAIISMRNLENCVF
jgi:hypothetical protein